MDDGWAGAAVLVALPMVFGLLVVIRYCLTHDKEEMCRLHVIERRFLRGGGLTERTLPSVVAPS